MNKYVADRIKKHVANGGKSLTIVPGNGFYSLSGKTSCTYLHDRDGLVSAVLLESSPGEDIVEAADFLCQQVVLAQSPTDRLIEYGLSGTKSNKLVMVTSFDGLPEESQEHIRGRLLSLSKKSFDMGHISEWSLAALEAMEK